MKSLHRGTVTRTALLHGLICLSFGVTTIVAQADSLEDRLTQFADYPHLELVTQRQEAVEDHQLGLGAMKKVRGTWGLKKSERVTGDLTAYTWRVIDGFGAEEVMDEVQSLLLPDAPENLEALYSCDGRSCGHGAQWASRVFGQRILYGRGDAQRYRIYSLEDGAYRLVLYASVRSSDRQYVHLELIRLALSNGTNPSEAPGAIPVASDQAGEESAP